ncbi:THO complex subunit 4-like [Uloborus diversus]|uniref:THO complex subunit 4-like n=1 Tax=Uloborus diversus TaxID=327109 RepID=UPI002409B7F8|nr:THO complex subunit 4-like [Uloborus diversus]
MAERMEVDLSLDDIIKRNRGKFSSNYRNRGGRVMRSRGTRGNRANNPGRGARTKQYFNRGNFTSLRGVFKPRARPAFLSTNTIRRGSINNVERGPAKLLISNLDYGVSDSDIKELFGDFGNLRKAVVHYDQSGRSLGTADVVFEKRNEAVRAMAQYNGVPLDGRAMKIQITSSFTPRFNSFSSNIGRRGSAGRGRGMTRGRGRGRGGFNRV